MRTHVWVYFLGDRRINRFLKPFTLKLNHSAFVAIVSSLDKLTGFKKAYYFEIDFLDTNYIKKNRQSTFEAIFLWLEELTAFKRAY